MADRVAPLDMNDDADLDTEEGPSLARRLTAEFVGTLLLTAVGTGAATVFLTGPVRLYGGLPPELQAGPTNPPTFQALLANGLGDLLPVALAFAAILAVLVYAFGGVSGAHFNPAVTIALAVANRFKWKDLPGYLVVQVIGGIAGAFIVAGIYGQDGASISGTDVLFGATTVAPGVDPWQAILAEAFITFVLVSAIMAVAIDPRAPKGFSGLIIGLALAAGIIVTGAATGGSANFARTLGPMVASLVYDVENIPWSDLYIYAAGPVIGAAAAALVYETVNGLQRPAIPAPERAAAPAPEPGAATSEGETPPREQKRDDL